LADIEHNNSRKAIKKVAFVLVCFATCLLVIAIIDVKWVFSKNETGLLDRMPCLVRQLILLSYPACLLASYVLFAWAIKTKTRLDTVTNILFLVNGLIVITLLIVYLIELTRRL